MTNDASDGSPGKLVPLVYNDLAAPAARVVGSTLADVVRIALSPANFVVWSFDQAKAFAEARVTELLAARRTPSDDVCTPDPQIAGPVINGLRLPTQGDSVRDLYLHLLASAMDGRTAPTAHPSFAEIIRQLSVREAQAISAFAGVGAAGDPWVFPTVGVRASMEVGYVQLLSHVSNIGATAGLQEELTPHELDNLARLGLIVLNSDAEIAEPDTYEPLEASDAVTGYAALADSRPGSKSQITRGIAPVTQYGSLFANVCTGRVECLGIQTLRVPPKPEQPGR